jgi:hypothetical protein
MKKETKVLNTNSIDSLLKKTQTFLPKDFGKGLRKGLLQAPKK